jgi:hypothetical protein
MFFVLSRASGKVSDSLIRLPMEPALPSCLLLVEGDSYSRPAFSNPHYPFVPFAEDENFAILILCGGQGLANRC